jgi:nitroreductase
MTTDTRPTAEEQCAALIEAARVGGHAPSVHNTQPWRWSVVGPTLELRAARDRQLTVTDPDGRLLTLSCGAALHHALVELAAAGFQAQVEYGADPADPDLFARVRIPERVPVTAPAMRLLQTIRIRHTDRRPVSDAPVPPSALEALRSVAEAEGAHLHVLRPDDVIELASAAARAQRYESLDPEWMAELSSWAVGGGGAGLTDDVLPATAPQTTVPGRDFGREGSLQVGPGHDQSAVYAILYGDEDTPLAWLRAGQALSAVWLHAVERDLSVLPLSATTEVPATRQTLRRLLADLGEPFLVLRLGVADPDHAGPPHTPRLPESETITVVTS